MSQTVSSSENASHLGFLGLSALLFGASAAITVVWCGSMSERGGMEMPDGWTMSMAWMRMPGQTWLGAGASFLGMWVVMTVAMMLPSLTSMLLRYRRSVGGLASSTRLTWLTALVGCGYFTVWTLIRALAFPLGAGLASFEMQEPRAARAVPLAVGLVVLMAGGLQFTAWKARRLACCRGVAWVRAAVHEPPERFVSPNLGTAWRHGLRLGIQCAYCCAGLTAILLVTGAMDLRAMAVVTAAITAERLAPGGERVATAVRLAIGVAIVGAGLFLIAEALKLA